MTIRFLVIKQWDQARLIVFHLSTYFFLKVQCANGQRGYGRRRRRDVDDNADAVLQQVYEVSMSTIVKVSDEATDRLVTNSQGRTKKTFISEEGKMKWQKFRLRDR